MFEDSDFQAEAQMRFLSQWHAGLIVAGMGQAHALALAARMDQLLEEAAETGLPIARLLSVLGGAAASVTLERGAND
ncbi:hypothetical protein EOD42_17575 [Rhodovarius crocodyli]|uniref:Uncharacterized protein n=1 Tax=Rhodovarius crocodyli TaxID=1979269 RepID=A0A437MCN2_9PROT|nr:hypothetical protein [Rhodovarius crocodyli]RVT95392.1 hypothetical protein EOD42_17575 [Rhodovarius crocodyli]